MTHISRNTTVTSSHTGPSGNTATQTYFERACANLLWMWRWFLERRLLDCSISRPASAPCVRHDDWYAAQIKSKFIPHPKLWIIKLVADSRKSSRHMCPLWKLKRLLLLRKSGRNSRQVCWRQQEAFGTSKPHRWGRETWWWNKKVDDAITAKRQAFKAWKAGKCTRASYNTAKRIADVWCTTHAMMQTRWSMRALTTSHLISSKPDEERECRCCRRQASEEWCWENVNERGGKQNSWTEHYERLLNVEFDWDPDHLSNKPPFKKARLSQSLLTWWRRPSQRWSRAKLQVHQA